MTTFTEEEGKSLLEKFKELNVKPKFDTKDDLETWLKEFGGDPTIKIEPKDPSTSSSFTLSSQFPRISLFYGDNVKGEATYPQWVYEVKCLLAEKQHKPEILAQAIRKSLRGEASNLLRRLGIGATIPEILEKFESVYGSVDNKENLLAKFYSAKQAENEDITKWSCRLEDILSTAVEKKLVEPKNVNDMLRNMFWQGLKPSLKDISGYKFEQVKDFDRLRVEMRKIEQEHSESQTVKTHINPIAEDKTEKNDMKEIKSMLHSLNQTVNDLEKKVNNQESIQQSCKPDFKQNHGGNNKRYNQNQNHNQQHFQNNQGNQNGPRFQSQFNVQQNQRYNNQPNQGFNIQKNEGYNNQSGRNFNSQQNQRFKPRYTHPSPTYQTSNQFQSSANTQGQQDQSGDCLAQGQPINYEGDNFHRGPLCYKCHQYGHYQWRCPVRRFDHSNHLN